MFKFFKKNKPPLADNTPTTLKLAAGLKRTRHIIAEIAGIFAKKIDQTTLLELEEKLILADVGVTVTQQIIDRLQQQIRTQKQISPAVVFTTLKEQLENILTPYSQPLTVPATRPFVILVVGVNGSGKTTTVGKLANKLQAKNYKVMLAAGDTFRAAAIEQLKIWGVRNKTPVIAQRLGADSAAVLFDACQAAKSRKIDILIADTAGRLHTQNNLMTELQKIKHIFQKLDPTAPHEILLVLDATTGQNALNQAQQFHAAIGVSGICLTKLDGTAKGGIIFAIAQKLQIPIRYIGIGENIDDLKPFVAKEFITALFY